MKVPTKIGLGLGAILIFTGLAIAWKNARHRTVPTKSSTTTKGRNTSLPFRCSSRTYPISYGTCHPDVKILQRYLKRLGADLGSHGRQGIDGRFGSLTLKASKAKLGKSSFDQQAIEQMKERLKG